GARDSQRSIRRGRRAHPQAARHARQGSRRDSCNGGGQSRELPCLTFFLQTRFAATLARCSATSGAATRGLVIATPMSKDNWCASIHTSCLTAQNRKARRWYRSWNVKATGTEKS